MAYQAVVLPHFSRQLKDAMKKYPRLKEAVIATLEAFDLRRHPHLGRHLYKVRLKAPGLVRGKSGSFRLILLLVEAERILVPLTLYAKSDREDITRREINHHLAAALFELRARSAQS